MLADPPSPLVLPRPVAAVVEDSFLEERRELANAVFGEGQSHLVDVQRRCRRLQHHAEKVPEVFLGRYKDEDKVSRDIAGWRQGGEECPQAASVATWTGNVPASKSCTR